MPSGRGHSFIHGDKATKKYLLQYAEDESLMGERLARRYGRFGHALAIPAQAEGQDLTQCLSAVPSGPNGPTLIVTVINARTDASEEVLKSNRNSLEEIDKSFGMPDRLSPRICTYEHPVGRLVVIDRSDACPMPRKQGVGLARKIGCDFLLGVIESGATTSPWIHCSDADTKLPPGYFEQAETQAKNEATALVYPFRHRRDVQNPVTYPIALEYESSLRYYVLGLRFAGSAHAFHSVGSALAVHANAYAQVRGFPRREAAEDFYLLNKLAKLGAIQQLDGVPIEPSSRSSNRVPFGTGAAIQKQLLRPQEEIQTYHPQVFTYLQTWEATIRNCQLQPSLAQNVPFAVTTQANATPGVESARLLEALEASGALSRAERALQGPASSIPRKLRDNLDSFRTLRLVHALRDTGLGKIGLREAIDKASFIELEEKIDELSIHEVATRLERLDYGHLTEQ